MGLVSPIGSKIDFLGGPLTSPFRQARQYLTPTAWKLNFDWVPFNNVNIVFKVINKKPFTHWTFYVSSHIKNTSIFFDISHRVRLILLLHRWRLKLLLTLSQKSVKWTTSEYRTPIFTLTSKTNLDRWVVK